MAASSSAVRSRPRPDAERIDGQPLGDSQLRRRIAAAVAELGEALGDASLPATGEPRSFNAAELALDRALDAIGEAIASEQDVSCVRELVDHLTAFNELQRELREAGLAHRSRALGRVHEALGRLRDVPSVDSIIEAIPAEVITLGFPRVILSRVRDSHWVPEVALIDGNPEWAQEVLTAGNRRPQRLDHMLLETEMVRRRMPMLVRDVQNDPRVHRPIAEVSLSTSYVAAPLMPEGRVVGFIHADCYTTGRDVDEFDRDLLWLFAEGAGFAFARVQALERLRELRHKVRGLTDSISESVDAVLDAEVELARIDREAAETTRAASADLVAERPLGALLTPREAEIAAEMAAGLTNAEIARRLVITEGTVKTHVSHILRKVQATNRAQAVSKLLTLGDRAGRPRPGA